MKENDPYECFVTVCLGTFIGVLIGFISGVIINKEWQQDAIANGVATFVVAEDGSTQFKWKESDQ
jgi:hypothetical protein